MMNLISLLSLLTSFKQKPFSGFSLFFDRLTQSPNRPSFNYATTRMEEPRVIGEWPPEIEDRRSYDDVDREEEKSSNWVLRLGKKILFAGFVVSSAPIALPSLLVVSALGLVVSIPSGVFLASYAFSEKLMSKLLPITDNNNEFEEEGMEEEEHRGVKRKTEIFGYEEDEKKQEDEEEEEAVLVIEEIVVEVSEEKGKPEVVEVVVMTSTTAEENNNDKEKEDYNMNNNINNKNEVEEETIGLLEKIRDEGEESLESDKSQTTIPLQEETSEIAAPEVNQSPVSTTSTATATKSTDESEEQPGVSSENPPQTSEAKKKKSSKKKATQQQQSSSRSSAQHKVEYDDKKIWEQIEAVRKIVGYNSTAQTTCVEELRALYIFTGVEPPPLSFKDPSDLAQLHNNLQFLKSIIGVN